ncbi:hypothetical protein NHQ30_011408 [Ciborinia camelliae]|nr:hypothetical protein NHQ30_011408 [Ciborinia camelliae]
MTQSSTNLNLLPGKEGTRFSIIHPAPSRFYQGVTISNPQIVPESIGGTWYPKPPPPSNAKVLGDVILHFHGGAYVIGNGRKNDAGFAAKMLLANTTASYIFCPQYRLASSAAGKFPAALQDAITSFHHLIEDLHIPAHNIVISGDSAGGNLVLALLRYLNDHPSTGLPNPGCAWLWSPWVDPASTIIEGIFHRSPHAATDYLDEGFGLWGATSFAPAENTGVTLNDPYISFLGNAFRTPTPLFFSAGECEVLFHDVRRACEEFVERGNKAEVQVERNAPHDILLTGHLLGFGNETVLATKRAGEFWERVRVG